VNLYTIGFTKTSAEGFFARLKESGTTRVVDVRLNNVSQLAGFAKRDDLRYFLKALCSMDYIHVPELAPTQEMLDEYKKGGVGWSRYAQLFLALMKHRQIENTVSKELLSNGCLLCSEDKPHHCHRRLVAEYLKEHWGDIDVRHL